jgi:hypothetical protein
MPGYDGSGKATLANVALSAAKGLGLRQGETLGCAHTCPTCRDEFLRERVQAPDFAEAFHEMEPEFQAAREVVRLRLDQGRTQKELAQRIGTQQAGISRLDSVSAVRVLAAGWSEE